MSAHSANCSNSRVFAQANCAWTLCDLYGLAKTNCQSRFANRQLFTPESFTCRLYLDRSVSIPVDYKFQYCLYAQMVQTATDKT